MLFRSLLKNWNQPAGTPLPGNTTEVLKPWLYNCTGGAVIWAWLKTDGPIGVHGGGTEHCKPVTVIVYEGHAVEGCAAIKTNVRLAPIGQLNLKVTPTASGESELEPPSAR